MSLAKTPAKSEGAFRTIREVADWLGVPTHVLRFWESKFEQVQPVKGAGGRRYYRPDDMRLLGGIKVLLHDQGQTIRGVVQRIEDEGASAVMAVSPALEMPAAAAPERRARKVIRSADVVPFDRAEPSQPVPEGVLPSAPAAPEDLDVPSHVETQPSPEIDDDATKELPVNALPEESPTKEEAVPQPIPEVLEADTSGRPDEARTEPDPTPPSDELPPEIAVALPPSLEALRLVRAAKGCSDARRLRRVARRLRGLVEEMAEELGA